MQGQFPLNQKKSPLQTLKMVPSPPLLPPPPPTKASKKGTYDSLIREGYLLET